MARVADVTLGEGPEVIQAVCPEKLAINLGDTCVVEADTVLEYGRISRLGELAALTEEPRPDVPRVLRRATLQDHARAQENALYLKMAMDVCRKKVDGHNLEMQIVKVRHSFDRKILTIVYTSEERVQFRDLVKELATELHCRVEMRQIGVRDAAKIVGGMGPCGRELCCCSWLKKFEAVSVRMAKAQRLSLNPNTISGVCGRLKCCLRYERPCYAEIGRNLPRDGALVSTPEGKGIVVDKNILARKIKVRLEDQRIMEFDAEALVVDSDQRGEPSYDDDAG